MRNQFLSTIIVSSALLSACTSYQTKPFLVETTPTLPNAAVEFETTITKADETQRHYRWYFWRADNRVEMRNPQDNSSEEWTRLANGQVKYSMIFHDDKKTIDYNAVDLEMIGETPNWTKTTLLISPEMMATLVSDSDETLFNQKATIYKTNLPNTVFEVTWLPQMQVPAMIKREVNGQSITTKIVSLEPAVKSMLSNPEASAYDHGVFADIGDMESVPFIKSVMHKLKGSHDHDHGHGE
jgi:hypothetical protein